MARNGREFDWRYEPQIIYDFDSRSSKITELRPFEQMLKSARGIGVNVQL